MLKMKQSKKLTIGSGKDIKDDFINLDIIKLPGVDVVHNLNKFPWPFKEDSFEEIEAFMILEHLDNIVKPLEEIWRISKNKAIIKIKVPFFPSVYSMSDPTHKQFFTYFTFDYFTPENHMNYYSKARFKIVERRIIFSWNKYLNVIGFFINLMPRFYSRYLSFLIPSNEIDIKLEVVK